MLSRAFPYFLLALICRCHFPEKKKAIEVYQRVGKVIAEFSKTVFDRIAKCFVDDVQGFDGVDDKALAF